MSFTVSARGARPRPRQNHGRLTDSAAVEPAAPVRRSGPSCMRKPFAGWVAARAWWCPTTCARACSNQTSTTPRSTPCTPICCGTMVWWRCPAGWGCRDLDPAQLGVLSRERAGHLRYDEHSRRRSVGRGVGKNCRTRGDHGGVAVDRRIRVRNRRRIRSVRDAAGAVT